jgi:hypothetical protein
MLAAVPLRRKWAIDNKWLWALALVALFATFVSITTVVRADWTGGYTSEVLMSRQGVTNSNFVIDNSGTTGSYLDMSTVGTVTTGTASGIGTASANLSATVSTLNGAPSALVYFEWGYDTSYGNTTATTTITSPSSVTLPVSGYDPDHEIYYRAVVETDGTAYGSGRFFTVGTFHETVNIFNTIVLSLIGLAMVIAGFKLLTATEIGILQVAIVILMLAICYYVVHVIIGLL